jgi:hypothetical protein
VSNGVGREGKESKMEIIGSVGFRDIVEGCDGYAGARAIDGAVAVVLSLANGGDVEVTVTPSEARTIAAMLVAGAERAERKS